MPSGRGGSRHSSWWRFRGWLDAEPTSRRSQRRCSLPTKNGPPVASMSPHVRGAGVEGPAFRRGRSLSRGRSCAEPSRGTGKWKRYVTRRRTTIPSRIILEGRLITPRSRARTPAPTPSPLPTPTPVHRSYDPVPVPIVTPTPTQPNPPSLSVSPAYLTFNATVSSTWTRQGNSSMSIMWGRTPTVTEKPQQAWISLYDAGSVAGGEAIGVQLKAIGMSPGTYNGTITIRRPAPRTETRSST